jgi:hypothetical protein
VNAIEAMSEVYGALDTDDYAWAQCAAMELSDVLPSSVFEKVLLASVKADQLLPQYAEFCRRAYGRVVYAEIVAAIAA